ncbi:hypothetical protein D9M72_590320 [compost metagenome]
MPDKFSKSLMLKTLLMLFIVFDSLLNKNNKKTQPEERLRFYNLRQSSLSVAVNSIRNVWIRVNFFLWNLKLESLASAVTCDPTAILMISY